MKKLANTPPFSRTLAASIFWELDGCRALKPKEIFLNAVMALFQKKSRNNFFIIEEIVGNISYKKLL
jgi:hypothetical protein